MPSERDITEKFWKALKNDRTFMLGLAGSDQSQPMTAQIEREDGPIWIFTSKETELVRAMGASEEAVAQFVSKNHDLFAGMHGRLTIDNDRAAIDRLWNPFVAAWYEGGKTDPKLCLLRLELVRAHIWLNENSLFAGVKVMLGSDPKKDYKDKTADVRLS